MIGGRSNEPATSFLESCQRLKLMCGYGGRIMPHPHVKLSVLTPGVRIRPRLGTLISMTSDEDFENMMEEYIKLSSRAASKRW